MIYDREPERKEQKTQSSLTRQRYSTDKDNYGSEYEAFRNRPQPRVNIDILQMMRETEQEVSTQETSESPIQAQFAETVNKTGLPDNLKAGIENLSGYSMNDVKVHYNSAKPSQLQAHAYAQGTDIHLAPGQEKHLPHEAWHVVQQMQGRVKPTLQMKDGVYVNDDFRLENEADIFGKKALSINNTQLKANQLKQVKPSGKTAQGILRNASDQTLVSTTDKTTIIDANNAAITVAATKDEATGGHAEIYLELFENATPVEYSLDMFGANEGRVIVRIKQYPMGEMNSRGKGGSKTYSITTAQADQALVAAAKLKIDAQEETLKYTYYLAKMWNWNPMSSVTYMNCADFAAAILNAAGIASSSGMLSMPKTVANEEVEL